MKNLLKCFVCLVLIFSLILAGCSCNDEDETSNNELKDTSIVLFDGKSSPYKVVVSNKATEWEIFASEELVNFFAQATGYELEVITDEGLSFSEDDCYFSLGENAVQKGSGVEASYAELGRDGFKLVRKGNTLIFIGGQGYGTIYAVYEFLEKNLGYVAYAPDEIVVPRTSNLLLKDFNLTDKPDIANRLGGYYVTTRDRVFATRLRTLAWYGDRLFQENNLWGSWAHTYFEYLPFDEYGASNPEWYSTDKTQLCLSNMEMRTALFEKIKERITQRFDSELFMIGQEDKSTFCSCPKCTEATEKIGTSGLMMQFINDIGQRVEEWQKTACPDRNIKIGTFAYQRTQTAPAVQNEDGEYVPIDPSVVARDNVFVLVAPIYADWCSPVDDVDHNLVTRNLLKGWQVCASSIAVWGYCNNFDYELEYFDNINTIAENYKIFRDMGVDLIYDESSASTKQAFAFQTMMAYIHSELMWDCEQNVDDLITNFMKAYYKEAYQPMRDYFNLMRTYVTTRKIELGEQNGKYYGTGIWLSDDSLTLMDKSFWKYSVLQQMIGYINQSYTLLEQAGYSTEQLEVMKLRVAIEGLTPQMYLLHLFSAEMNANEYLQMVDEFENITTETGISRIFRDESPSTTIAKWRANVA